MLKLKKRAQVKEYSPTVKLADEDFIARAIWDCLKDNAPKALLRSSKPIWTPLINFNFHANRKSLVQLCIIYPKLRILLYAPLRVRFMKLPKSVIKTLKNTQERNIELF